MRWMAVCCCAVLLLVSCGAGDETPVVETRTIPLDVLRDKIAGGWAGKMIGVAYGGPTEFGARGETYDRPIEWETDKAASSIGQDDMYVQLTFMMTMDEYGIDAPAERFAEMFAKAGYRLWHANAQARKNYFDGIMPPESGAPEYNLHADDIDFQIEADYIGFMCPGMPQTAVDIADKVGHIMNYGDGVYGGIFVAALYTGAFFNDDIPAIIERALLSIPAESDYAECIRDVILLHEHYPGNWRAAWAELEKKWGAVDICGALDPFNIDAKLNGAYIVMGLLYGDGDFGRTVEIATRCGQDSDCNPSNAAAVIGVIEGYDAIPDYWKGGIESVADSTFIFTDYSFNSAVDNTLEYATGLIADNGGTVSATEAIIRLQEPQAPPMEDAFPRVVPDELVDVTDSRWQWSGGWNTVGDDRARFSGSAGDEATFTFEGTGVVIRGDWVRDGGIAEVYVDGELHRRFDSYYYYARQEHRNNFLWHVLHLEPVEHTVRIVVQGEKRPESEGTNLYITGATIFQTGPKINDRVELTLTR